MHLAFWWATWTYREVDHWTFRAFASVMLTPSLMYLTVSIPVSDNPAAIESWRDFDIHLNRPFPAKRPHRPCRACFPEHLLLDFRKIRLVLFIQFSQDAHVRRAAKPVYEFQIKYSKVALS